MDANGTRKGFSMTATRRQIIAGMASMVAASHLIAPPAFAKSPLRKPSRLRKGDAVGLIAPATPSSGTAEIERAETAIRNLGLIPKRGKHLEDQFGYLAGSDRSRAADVTAMFADKQVKAIFALRGGWGCARMLPYIDWNIVRANPKLLIGYSDITALHMAIAAKAGFATIHGPNATSSWWENSEGSFQALAFDGERPTFGEPPKPASDNSASDSPDDTTIIPPWPNLTIGVGKARGRLLGGNLTVLNALVGTQWLPDFEGAILFLEDVDEAEYRIDRMLTQMGQAGLLKKLSGFVFGQCTSCKARGSESGFKLSTILQQHIAPLGIPAFSGANFGHIRNQYCIPVGVQAEIDADAGTLRMLETVVV